MTIARIVYRDWQERAVCRGEPYEVFFIREGQNRSALKRARTLCAVCPVIGECRAECDATETNTPNEVHGFRAGETPLQRMTRRKAEGYHRDRKLSPVWH